MAYPIPWHKALHRTPPINSNDHGDCNNDSKHWHNAVHSSHTATNSIHYPSASPPHQLAWCEATSRKQDNPHCCMSTTQCYCHTMTQPNKTVVATHHYMKTPIFKNNTKRHYIINAWLQLEKVTINPWEMPAPAPCLPFTTTSITHCNPSMALPTLRCTNDLEP